MTADKNAGKSLTRGKMLLIATLGSVLWFVLPDFPDSGAESTSTSVAVRLAEEMLNIPNTSRDDATGPAKSFSLAELIENNPFDISATPVSLATDQSKEAAANSSPEKVEDPVSQVATEPAPTVIQAIIGHGENAMVLIEGEPYGVGDALPDGFVITRIDQNGIRVRHPTTLLGN